MGSFFKKIQQKLTASSSLLGTKIKNFFTKGWSEEKEKPLLELFYEADLGVEVSRELVEIVKKIFRKDPEIAFPSLTEKLEKEVQERFFSSLTPPSYPSPHIILFVGSNGSGKTTSIAKLASYFQKQGKKVLLAAADTFRAAAVEQLSFWAQKMDIPIIKSQQGADPASVVFDALEAFKSRHMDILLIDTAGRLHNKQQLMEELKKIGKIVLKHSPSAHHSTLLVLDATMGQNAIVQATLFGEMVPLQAVFVSKMDATAKAGVLLSLAQHKLYPHWIGTGEGLEDVEIFDVKQFLSGLFASQ